MTHRFINADGLVSTGTGVLGYNMFAYCENNPVIHSDSTGNHYDDEFKESWKIRRMIRGGHQRRISNQSRQKYCPDEVSPSYHFPGSTFYPVTAEFRRGHVEQNSYGFIFGGYEKEGVYSIENYSPSIFSIYASTGFECGINTPNYSYSLGIDNIGIQRGITINNSTYSIETSFSIRDCCYRVGWDKTTYDGNESFSVIGRGLELNGMNLAFAAVYIYSMFSSGTTVTQGAY